MPRNIMGPAHRSGEEIRALFAIDKGGLINAATAMAAKDSTLAGEPESGKFIPVTDTDMPRHDGIADFFQRILT